jgi:hypothetical protein
MSPEEPGSLVVLNVHPPVGDIWNASIDTLSPTSDAGDWPFVSWSATECTGDMVPMGSGVVCVEIPAEGYRRRHYPASLEDHGNGWVGWTYPISRGGLMVVLWLPAGYILPSEEDVTPSPRRAKTSGNRLALYWLIPEGASAVLCCRPSKIDTDDLAQAARVSASALMRRGLSEADRPSPVPIRVDVEDT